MFATCLALLKALMEKAKKDFSIENIKTFHHHFNHLQETSCFLFFQRTIEKEKVHQIKPFYENFSGKVSSFWKAF